MPPPSTDPTERILTLKAQRTQLQGRLEEWEAQWQRVHGRDATDADRRRSSQRRELSRLLGDVDSFISSLEVAGSSAMLRATTTEGEQRAERGRVKARMRRWDREFERTHNRKPTDADHERSEQFVQWQLQLRNGDAAPSTETALDNNGGARVAADACANAQSLPGEALPAAVLASTDGSWWQGSDYHELLRSRVQSQAAVNGFDGVSAAEARARLALYRPPALTHLCCLDTRVPMVHELTGARCSGNVCSMGP